MAGNRPSASLCSGSVLNGWMPVMLIGCCALVLACIPGALTELRYERAGLAAGQSWRALTAHVVHLDITHLLYNFLGLALIHELLWTDLPARHKAGLALCAALGISGALWRLQPEIAWYAGSSGVLHGLWSGCALAGCLRMDGCSQGTAAPAPARREGKPVENRRLSHRHVCVAALVVLSIKLHGNLLPGDAVTTGASGLPVVPSAHLYGALTGTIYVIAWRLMQYCLQYCRAR